MYLDHEGNRTGDTSPSWGQPNTRVHTVLSRRRARQGPGEWDVQMPLSCLPEPYKSWKTKLNTPWGGVGRGFGLVPGHTTLSVRVWDNINSVP